MAPSATRFAALGIGMAAALGLLLLAFLERPGLRLELDGGSQMSALRDVQAMRAQLRKALEAEQQALLAPTREQATEYATQAEQAAREVESGRQAVEKTLAPGQDALREPLETFARAWSELREIAREFLPLVVQKTNTLASMLQTSEGIASLERLENALGAALRRVPGEAQACFAVLAEASKILALEGPHISEGADARMDALEAAMRLGADRARTTLDQAMARAAKGQDAEARELLARARAELDAFLAVNAKVVELSRINSDVKSLALSLQRKQNAAAACEAALAAVQGRIEERLSRATR